MTDLENDLAKNLGFAIRGRQVQFGSFDKDDRWVVRAVMPPRDTDVKLWDLLVKKQVQLNELRTELELTRQALELAKTVVNEVIE